MNKSKHAGLFALLLLNTVFCGMAQGGEMPKKFSTQSTEDELYTGPAEFKKYVVKFVADAKTQGVDVAPALGNPKLQIVFYSLAYQGSGTAGQCLGDENQTIVIFDPLYWNVVDDTRKEILLYHELGHCILHRRHVFGSLQSGAPASIMNASLMPSADYLEEQDYYLYELFGGAQ